MLRGCVISEKFNIFAYSLIGAIGLDTLSYFFLSVREELTNLRLLFYFHKLLLTNSFTVSGKK